MRPSSRSSRSARTAGEGRGAAAVAGRPRPRRRQQYRADRRQSEPGERRNATAPLRPRRLATPDVLVPTVQQLRQEQVRLTVQYNQQLKTYKPEYSDMIALKQQLDDVTRQLNTSAETIRRSPKTQYDAAEAQTNRCRRSSTSRRPRCSTSATARIQYNILQREVDSTRTLYEGPRSTATSRSASRAASPRTTSPSSTGLTRPKGRRGRSRCATSPSLAGAGAAIGSMLAILLETMDQAIRRPADVEAKLGFAGARQRAAAGQGLGADGGAGRPAFAVLGGLPLDPAATLAFSTKDGAPKVLSVHQRASRRRQVDHRVRAGAGLRPGRDAGATGRPRSAQSDPAQDARRRQSGRRVEPS